MGGGHGERLGGEAKARGVRDRHTGALRPYRQRHEPVSREGSRGHGHEVGGGTAAEDVGDPRRATPCRRQAQPYRRDVRLCEVGEHVIGEVRRVAGRGGPVKRRADRAGVHVDRLGPVRDRARGERVVGPGVGEAQLVPVRQRGGAHHVLRRRLLPCARDDRRGRHRGPRDVAHALCGHARPHVAVADVGWREPRGVRRRRHCERVAGGRRRG